MIYGTASPPKGTINTHTNNLDIPKPHDRDLTIPILNLDQNLKITIAGENIRE